jgi:hypothetical protein
MVAAKAVETIETAGADGCSSVGLCRLNQVDP